MTEDEAEQLVGKLLHAWHAAEVYRSLPHILGAGESALEVQFDGARVVLAVYFRDLAERLRAEVVGGLCRDRA